MHKKLTTAMAAVVLAGALAAAPTPAHAVRSHDVRDCYYVFAGKYEGDRLPLYGMAREDQLCWRKAPRWRAWLLGIHRTPHVTREYRVLG
jgi:hypothetical protein